jgi:hypothetical protein
MWSYKVLSKNGGIGDANWGAVTNADPMPRINFETDSRDAIDRYFAGFATQKLAFNEPLLKALSNPKYVVKPFVAPAVRTTAPQGSLPGWTTTDVGGALTGGLDVRPGGEFDLFGGGNDIWGNRDDFRFLHQTLTGDGTLEVTVRSTENIDTYTKAGLMLRAGLAPDAPFVLLSIFPSGEMQIARRERAGEAAVGSEAKYGTFPNLTLRIVRRAGTLYFSYRTATGPDQPIGTLPDFLPPEVQAGPIALSHSPSELVKISYQNLTVVR